VGHNWGTSRGESWVANRRMQNLNALQETPNVGKNDDFQSLSWATWATKGQNDCCFS
jgi:hypothetical protein